MTAVVLAATYEDAYRAAGILGLGQSWIYPHSAELLRGVQVDRVVHVSGWYSTPGTGITDDIRRLVQSRVTNAVTSDLVNLDNPGGLPLSITSPAPLRVAQQGDADTRRKSPSWAGQLRGRPWWFWPLQVVLGLIGAAVGYFSAVWWF